jgi:hypothetical protein
MWGYLSPSTHHCERGTRRSHEERYRRFPCKLSYFHPSQTRRRTTIMPSPTSDPPCIEPKTKMTDDNLTETEEQRRQRERQRNKYLHVALIVEHASRCNSSACRSSNCEKMKSYMKHGLVCTVQAPGGCLLCKRAWTLLRVHSQQCKIDNCHVPQCHAMKKCKRQLQHMSK